MTPTSSWTQGPLRRHLLDWGGGGVPLLLLHGMAGNVHWWDAAAPLLRPVYRPIALDFRGHGDSDWLEDGLYDAQGFLDDIEAARKAAGIGRMVLAGHSLGARVAIGYAADRLDDLLGLVAIDFLPEASAMSSRSFARARLRSQPVYADPEAALARFRLEPRGTLLGDADLRRLGEACIRPAVPETRARGGAPPPRGGWTWKFDWRAFQYRYESVWPLIPRLRLPALFVRGAESPILPREDLRRIGRELPGARTVEIPRALHHVPLDAPRELAAEMVSLLDPRLLPSGSGPRPDD